MSILDKIWIKITSKHIATDNNGNEYYQSKKTDYLGRNARYVIYKDAPEPSTVPPIFHAWLHYLSDKIPDSSKIKDFIWQKDYHANSTGTKFAYSPLNKKNKRSSVSSDYQPFNPNIKTL